ncbi:MAG: AsnC family transcriptional regulator [Verrucomicrobiales bacterium]|nr:AsnC family transcriptional regulator [Verrucomicrobiales bacterium]
MDELLKLLRKDASLKPVQLAGMLNSSEEEISKRIADFETDGTILAYHAILNESKIDSDSVRAVIEVKLTPERGGGFDRLAGRIAKYSEVSACYLMSGAYDLLVVIEGDNLQNVARFVAEKLATIEGVVSTSTHFMLKAYKQQGVLMHHEETEERLAVTP